MPRGQKCRMISGLPEYEMFSPRGRCGKDLIIMSVDEYEVIKLIDYLDLTQEEASIKMNVARTTVQQIYANARKKLALMLISGRPIKISGGNYKLCNRSCYNKKDI